MPITTLEKEGAFDADLRNAINTNFADVVTLDGASQTIAGKLSWQPSYAAYAGTSDVVTFPAAINVALFTGSGVDAATLAVPGSADAGKILVLISTNGSANTVTVGSASKLVTGSASAFTTATAPAHSGAMAILVASNGFWNTNPLGTGAWTLA